MKDFNEYAIKAIERCNLKSYYGLAKELGISHAALHRLKTGESLPSCNTMIKLSKLAGITEEQALLNLATWANSDKPEVQKIWLRIAKMISCFLVFFIFFSKPCISKEIPSPDEKFQISNVYIMRQIILFFSRLKNMLQFNNLSKLRGAI